jgi:polysaccharide deacetylase 2 family uncharacterized protein YibQ
MTAGETRKTSVNMPKKNSRNRRKRKDGFRPFLYIILTILVTALVLFLLETARKPAPPKPPALPPPAVKKPKPTPPPQPVPQKPVAPEKQVVPEKPPVPEKPSKPQKPAPVHKKYTSAAVRPPVELPPLPAGTGRVALIIDDMGTRVSEVEELMSIGIPLTFSVIPGLREAREVAEAAHSGGYQVMVHIPMQPKDYPQRRLEGNGLLLSYDNEEIVRRMSGYFSQVPHAVGANNHMGSGFTEDREKMGEVLKILKSRKMFFVDSMTTPKSVGLSISREIGLPAVARTAPFIDNSEDVAAIKVQLGALARMAVKRGSAIGICHPHRATIRALKEELPVLKGRGIRFVSVSSLVR